MISELGVPAATVICACENFSRIARSAGKLITTSPSCPKSMTSKLRGWKSIVDVATGSRLALLLQMLVKKVRACVIRSHPIFVYQKTKNLIGHADLFNIHL